MSSVTVDSSVIQKVIRNCTDSIARLERTKLSLQSRYQEQGSTWSDLKYQYLGSIIAECNTAIGKVIAELAGCVSKLEQINTYIQEYEGVNFNEKSDATSVNGLFHLGRQVSPGADITSTTRNTNSQELSWKRILSAHSAEQDLSATNPNWSQNGDIKWKVNCQRCVPTYEMRRRGYDVTARESPGSDYLSQHPFDVWENANVIQCSGNGYYDIREQMSSWGDGARAQVTVMWTRTRGHTFIAEQIDGVTHFFEPQNGNSNVERYFSDVREGETRFCRIDNLAPSQRIFDCCEEVMVND